jgi:arsenite methyltransferase
MTGYLSQSVDLESPELLEVFDEAPLWSALFGQLLLEQVPLRGVSTALDVACGAGFPLLDLAQRLGPNTITYGLDLWRPALERARKKVTFWQIPNVILELGDATAMSFADAMFDLVTCNLGLNNVGNPLLLLRECVRVLNSGGTLALTTNLVGHMREFYAAWEELLRDQNDATTLAALQAHIGHRATVPETLGLLEQAGFRAGKIVERDMVLRYANGTALFNHSFTRLAFLGDWKELVPQANQVTMFAQLEERLNQLALQRGDLTLTIPMLYLEGIKP